MSTITVENENGGSERHAMALTRVICPRFATSSFYYSEEVDELALKYSVYATCNTIELGPVFESDTIAAAVTTSIIEFLLRSSSLRREKVPFHLSINDFTAYLFYFAHYKESYRAFPRLS